MNLPVPELKNDDNIKESSCPHSSLSLSPYSDDIVSNINDTITNLLVDRSVFNLQMVQFLKLFNIAAGILHGTIFLYC